MTLGTERRLSEHAPRRAREHHEARQRRDTMATTPGSASSNLPGKPPVVDRATWRAARKELLAREKAHTREGDAIAAARRRLPMVEVAADSPLLGPHGAVTLLDAFEGRRQLIAYYFMWYDGAPFQGQ